MHLGRRTGSANRTVASISAVLHLSTNNGFSEDFVDPLGSLISRIDGKERIFDSRRVTGGVKHSEVDESFYILLCSLTDGIPYLTIETEPSPRNTNTMFTSFINVLESTK